MGLNCFRRRFRTVQDKFQRLDEILKDFPGFRNWPELEALRREVQVLCSQNIYKVERRIDALSASLTSLR